MHPLDDPVEHMDRIEALLVETTDINVCGLSRQQVGAMACRLEKLRDLADGLRGEIAAEGFATGVALDDGLKRFEDYVALHTPAKPSRVAQDRILGEWVRGYPTFRTAARRGWLNRDRLTLLKAQENSRTRQALHDDQWILADAARYCSWTDFVAVVEYWRNTVDPDGAAPSAQREDRRATTHKGPGGVVSGSFQLDAINGHAALTALDQEVRRLEDQDDRTGVTRTRDQRTADALVNLLARGATRPDGSLPAPLVHIVMGYRTAQELLRRFNPQPDDPAPTPGPIPVDPHDPDWRCELSDGTPLHPYAAYHALGDATLRRLVLDDRSDTRSFAPLSILDLSGPVRPQGTSLTANRLAQLMEATSSTPLGTDTRTFAPRHKQALIAAARGRCNNRGCNAGHRWLQADHVQPHSKGGATHLHNAQLLCQPDNRAKRDTVTVPTAPLAGTTPSRK